MYNNNRLYEEKVYFMKIFCYLSLPNRPFYMQRYNKSSDSSKSCEDRRGLKYETLRD